MSISENWLRIKLQRANDYINNVILDEKLDRWTVFWFRALPWIFSTTAIGLNMKAFYWGALYSILLFFAHANFFFSNFFNARILEIYI